MQVFPSFCRGRDDEVAQPMKTRRYGTSLTSVRTLLFLFKTSYVSPFQKPVVTDCPYKYLFLYKTSSGGVRSFLFETGAAQQREARKKRHARLGRGRYTRAYAALLVRRVQARETSRA